ncbi:MAG: glycosyltransferase, partial [Alphaproteobacteria bacterium]
RLDCCKNVSLLVQAFDHDGLAAMNAHLLFAGDGPERAALARHFGPRASLPGALPQIDAARVLASADLFVFPSQLETFANVVRECLASGTGALVSNRGGGAGDVDAGVTGRYLPPDDPAAWRDAARAAAADPDRTAAWGTAAAAVARRWFPSWADVLARDLIPVWQEAAAGGAGIIRRAA